MLKFCTLTKIAKVRSNEFKRCLKIRTFCFLVMWVKVCENEVQQIVFIWTPWNFYAVKLKCFMIFKFKTTILLKFSLTVVLDLRSVVSKVRGSNWDTCFSKEKTAHNRLRHQVHQVTIWHRYFSQINWRNTVKKVLTKQF